MRSAHFILPLSWIGSTGIQSCITHPYLLMCQILFELEKTFFGLKGLTDNIAIETWTSVRLKLSFLHFQSNLPYPIQSYLSTYSFKAN